MFAPLIGAFLASSLAGSVAAQSASDLDSCPGYAASNVRTTRNGLTADLSLAGSPCNVYGEDAQSLKLEVTYDTDTRLHVKITDPTVSRYEVPDSVFPRPKTRGVSSHHSQLAFQYTESPFGFSIVRKSNNEVLFTTGQHPIIVEPQYLRVKTDLPQGANIYGLGEHTNDFRLNPDDTTITLWTRDAYGVPEGTNLYGDHPIYFEHRETGTHGVFLLNSDGMDIKLTPGALEYNVIGGVLDFYFLAGSENDPTETARQYSDLAGKSAEVPYWALGFHQCRFGYQNFVDVANVITNYSSAQLPLETMWTDIDYMDRRRVFTLDPDYFPLDRMREIVDYLHNHDQKYVVMTDPAVYKPNESETYDAYTVGKEMDVFLKGPDGEESLGLVWPGVTVYPDWFHPQITEYWNGQFASFYDAETGLDVDGMWIDMNEPASFCDLPCTDIYEQAIRQGMPPPRPNPPPPHDAPIFQNTASKRSLQARDPDQDIMNPPYRINNAAPTGNLSSKTAFVNAVHANGLLEYDAHNIFGTMMSSATREAMINRRPGRRPLIITRSTFAGAGKHVGKWLGDNLSTWQHYKNSIAGMLGFASIYQVPMVGADICGFGGDVTENLCARWAMLGSFYPFMRNHNQDNAISQEFYRWPLVAQAARNALDMRYRLLDYIYTAFHQAHVDGTPILQPLYFQYPKDQNTYSIDTQFFYGDSILVAPVIDEDSTQVNVYLPKDTFYDFTTLKAVEGQGSTIPLTVNFTSIPVYIKGGAILPLRTEGAMTTTELRKTSFELIVAPGGGWKGQASGQLYLDDGESISPPSMTLIKFDYSRGKLRISGNFGYHHGMKLERVKILGVPSKPHRAQAKGISSQDAYDSESGVVTVDLNSDLDKEVTIEVE